MTTKLEILKGIGSEWKKADKHRIYFNNLGELYGIETDRYNTGNIAYATLDGEKISNSAAKRLLETLSDCKVFYDVIKDDFYMQTPTGSTTHKEMCSACINVLRKFLAEKESELKNEH